MSEQANEFPGPGWMWRRRLRSGSPLWARALDDFRGPGTAKAQWLRIWFDALEQGAVGRFRGGGESMMRTMAEYQSFGGVLARGERDSPEFREHADSLPRKLRDAFLHFSTAFPTLPDFTTEWSRWLDAQVMRFMAAPRTFDESAARARVMQSLPARLIAQAVQADAGAAAAGVGPGSGINVAAAAGLMQSLLRWREDYKVGIVPLSYEEFEAAGFGAESFAGDRTPDGAQKALLDRARRILQLLDAVEKTKEGDSGHALFARLAELTRESAAAFR